MLNYLKKFAMDILPSVAATIIGAYIVNHYIATKPGVDAPIAAALSTDAPKAADTKPAGKPAEVANLPTAGVKAKGISEKAMLEKTASERPTVVEKVQEKSDAKSEAKADVKPADAPTETANIPADPRRHAPAPRDKVRVILPSPVQAVTPTVAPTAAAPVPAPPVDTASVPDERRDANDLARAAIERLRGGENAPRQQEAARIAESSRTEPPRIEASRAASAPALRPLPPPITVSTPAGGPLDQASQAKPPYAANAEIDPRRPTPPADIPISRPLDLRAEVTEPPAREHTSVAEDVLSAAKSVFHAVLPK
jgi:hypothetical protein